MLPPRLPEHDKEMTSAPKPADGDFSPAAPMVSVLMITYNHEPFIAQAIESVLAQQTSFPIELVIGEDHSQDRTLEIALDFQSRHPDRIRVLTSETNLGAQRNFGRTFEACRGKYIALLEGDDYWTAPDKLQKQVDFLESHPAFVAAAHNAAVIDDAKKAQAELYSSHTSDRLTNEDFLTFNHVPTCSVMFRRNVVARLPEWFFQVPAGDWVLHILNTRLGDMHYDPQPMACYRSHAGGMWSGMARSRQLQAVVDIYEHLLRELGPEYQARLHQLMSLRLRDLMYQCEKEDDINGARQALSRYGRLNAWRPALLRPDLLLARFRFYAPGAYGVARRLKSALFGASDKPAARTLSA